jgi:tuftelin-interacting protein 11
MAHRMNAFAAGSSSDESEEEQDDFLHPSTDPGAEEFADYNPRKRRRTRRDPRESAALGIFGSESEDEGPTRRWKSRNMRAKGMSFVKSGQNAGGANDEEDEEDEGEELAENAQVGVDVAMDENDDNDAEEDMPRMGLGATKAGGLGSAARGPAWQSPAMQRVSLGTMSASPLGRGFVPSSAAIPVLQETEDENPPPRVALPSAFSTPTTGKFGKAGANSGKVTSGVAGSFAQRMMAKMGYKEGQGLGKDGQGRSGVIEVHLRPTGVGLGAVKEKSKQEKEEERRQAALRGQVLEDSEEEKKRRRKAKTSGTDSGTSTPKRRPKTKFQSLPELQRAAPGLHIPDAFTPILDMTGPGQKLLTSTSGLLTPTTGTEPTELVEAKKLARRAQNDLSSFVEEWKNLEERKAWVEMELLQQQQAIDEQNDVTGQMVDAAEIVQGLAQAVKDGQWDPVITALKKVDGLGVTGNEELSNIAVAAVHPFFRQAIEGWQPLEDPKLNAVASDGFAPSLYRIRELLGMVPNIANGHALISQSHLSNGSSHSRSHKSTPYESMMYTVWFPKVRSAITNTWDVYDPTPLQALLEAWEGLIPSFILSQILDKLIVPKLDEAVAAWNPKKKRSASPPHLWLFPWLQFLAGHHVDPTSSSGLVSDVKRKFRHLIDAWDFRRGVIPGLQQWRSVLHPDGHNDQWTPLIRNHVLPNLATYLRANFQIAPQDQEPFMIYLNNTLLWKDILGVRDMGQLLVDVMFPMWHNVLHQWLTLDGVNYLEIRDWFDFWRSIIPADLNAVPAVRTEWQKGNDMINLALDLGPSAKSHLPPPIETGRSKDQVAMESPKPTAPVKPVPEITETTFRHQVEDWCVANDLQFIPEKSTLEANGPVYRVTAAPIGKGGVLIYLQGDNIYAQIKRGEWTPLGKEMDALLALAYR